MVYVSFRGRIWNRRNINVSLQIKQERFQERECLVKAFVLIDVKEEGCITLGQWKRYRYLQ